MKKTLSLLLVAVFLCSGVVLAADKPKAPAAAATKPATGADWILMTPKEKVDYLNAAIQFLQGKGIPFRKPVAYYGTVINQVVDLKGAEKAPIISILTTAVYKDDPNARAILDRIKAASSKPALAVPAAQKASK